MHGGRGAAPMRQSLHMKLTRTRLLFALLVLVVLLQLFPERAALLKLAAVGSGVLYFASWGGAKYLAQRKLKAAEAAQEAADAAEYQQYEIELNAIRAKYDPDANSADPTAISPEYREALTVLHDAHQAMLARKFGPRQEPG